MSVKKWIPWNWFKNEVKPSTFHREQEHRNEKEE